jgi:membrane protease YdiL (CAAX protease family)
MAAESAVLAFPLLALSRVLGNCMALYSVEGEWQGGVVLALGAGIYEESVFRLGTITLLNIALIDVLRMNRGAAIGVILVGSSVLFGAYHYWSPESGWFDWGDFVFRTASGVYFGFLFMTRGFGVTAGCHTAYDVYYFVLRGMMGR